MEKQFNLRTKINLDTHQGREQVRTYLEVLHETKVSNEQLEKTLTVMALIALNESPDKCSKIKL